MKRRHLLPTITLLGALLCSAPALSHAQPAPATTADSTPAAAAAATAVALVLVRTGFALSWRRFLPRKSFAPAPSAESP